MDKGKKSFKNPAALSDLPYTSQKNLSCIFATDMVLSDLFFSIPIILSDFTDSARNYFLTGISSAIWIRCYFILFPFIFSGMPVGFSIAVLLVFYAKISRNHSSAIGALNHWLHGIFYHEPNECIMPGLLQKNKI